MTPLDLEAVRARLDRATPWPWQWGTFYRDSFPDRPVAVASGDGRTDAVVFVEPSVDRQPESYDADFIANAPADIAALLAEVKRLRGLLARSEVFVGSEDCEQCSAVENLCADHDAYNRGWDEAVEFGKRALDNLGDLLPHLPGAGR